MYGSPEPEPDNAHLSSAESHWEQRVLQAWRQATRQGGHWPGCGAGSEGRRHWEERVSEG